MIPVKITIWYTPTFKKSKVLGQGLSATIDADGENSKERRVLEDTIDLVTLEPLL